MSKNKIKCIHVGLGNFSIKRLEQNINGDLFDPIAFVDVDTQKGLEQLSKVKGIYKDYKNRIFKNITEANKHFKSDACFIFVSSEIHSKLIIESLENNLHTFCVKSIACDSDQFKKILKTKKNKDLILVQGLNNKYSKASFEMKKILNDKSKFGELIMGNCITWGRQNLKSDTPLVDTTHDGIFFHSMGCHQLGQLIEWIGMPEVVYCKSPTEKDLSIGFTGVERTSSGIAILEFQNGSVFSYSATRAAHSNPFGFAARWSGSWIFHGSNADVKREGGRISIFRENNMIGDIYVDDLDIGLINNEIMQIEDFYLSIKNENKEMEKKSLDTWILMEALNESSRRNKKIYLKEFKNEFEI